MRWMIVAVLLAGCASQPVPQPEVKPEPVTFPVGKYDRLDALMEYALDGYARGDMQAVHNMSMVLDNLTHGVDLSRLATVAGLRVAMVDALQSRCEASMDPQSEECYASRKAGAFFDVVEIVVRDIGWRIDETYTIAEYERRARRALALYEWSLTP